MVQKILIIRFSALGDVAISIPVIAAFAKQHPESQVYVLSKRNFSSIFENVSENVFFLGADFQNEHKGVFGLWSLFKQLKRINPNYIIDLHGVLRSHFIRTLFFLSGKKTASIKKGRKEKKALTKRNHKVFKRLLPVVERYKRVFSDIGFDIVLDYSFVFQGNQTNYDDNFLKFSEGKTNLAIAPFAKHQGKIYPALKMVKLLEMLAQKGKYEIFLFGGGKDEMIQMVEWQQKIPSLQIVAGRMSLQDEICIMKKMNMMITMDSANMHLASLAGVRVISIWGATHPYAGFGPLNQNNQDIIQIELNCRPCSVFGNKACYRKDYACLNGIEPEIILDRIENVV
jgi:ADP-heptose:LPS heptosyltransferase